jgi:photosystem II stability/assembly factor-like uncharacterized protein
MRRSHDVVRLFALAALVVVVPCSAATAQPEAAATDGHGKQGKSSPRAGEGKDYAFRRAKAYHDMYAGHAGSSRSLKSLPQSSMIHADGAGPAARLMVLDYSQAQPVDPEVRLRASKLLKVDAAEIKRTGFSLLGLGPTGAADSAWINVGPTNFAGRVVALAIDPRDPQVIYRGSAGGGVWKSVDGGAHWTVLTDLLGNLSIGAIAVAPSAPNIVYVGTGEGSTAIDGIDGLGFIKSSKGGEPSSWELPDKVDATKFFALSVHPTNPDEILAATSSGILKSTNGGKNWAVKLSKYAGTALARSTSNPQEVLATAWDISRGNDSTSRGYVYISDNGGDTWTEVGGSGHAPFSNETGRIALALSPTNPQIAYLLAASAKGDVRNSVDAKSCPEDKVDQTGVYRSTNGGLKWSLMSNPVSGDCKSGFESILSGQGWYANTLLVDRSNPAVVYAGGLEVWKSEDGGKNWLKKTRQDLDPSADQYAHADVHTLQWDGPSLLIGDDGGVSITTAEVSKLRTLDVGVVTRQYYSVSVTPTNQDYIIGGAQDNGTNFREGSGSTYVEVIGGDGFGTAVNPRDSRIVYGSVYNSRIFRSVDGGKVFDELTIDFAPDELRPFITPLAMDPKDPKVLYTGSNFLWKTQDGGDHWFKPSATDLGDGGRYGYITKIAIAKTDSGRILTASGSGNINLSPDGGKTWNPVLGLPGDKYASHVEFDPRNSDVFYVAFMSGPAEGRLFKTIDGGQKFTRIDSGQLSIWPIHVVRVSPTDSNVLFAGTDVGLYRSVDGGTSWELYGQGLPAVSIWDIAFLPQRGTIRVATHGRGFYEAKLASVQ